VEVSSGGAAMKEVVRRRAYLREAVLALAIAKAAAFFLRADVLLRHANKRARRLSRFRGDEVPWIGWAVAVAAGRMSLVGTSLPAALATQIMLRRRGIASQLWVGIEPGNTFTSHAWVELSDGRAVGDIDVARLAKLLPSAAASRARAVSG
jgi:transglutaminase superfamily protein